MLAAGLGPSGFLVDDPFEAMGSLFSRHVATFTLQPMSVGIMLGDGEGMGLLVRHRTANRALGPMGIGVRLGHGVLMHMNAERAVGILLGSEVVGANALVNGIGERAARNGDHGAGLGPFALDLVGVVERVGLHGLGRISGREGTALDSHSAQVLIALALNDRHCGAVDNRAVGVGLSLRSARGGDGGLVAGNGQIARAHLHAEVLGVDDAVIYGYRPGAGEVDAQALGDVQGGILQHDGVVHVGTVGADAPGIAGDVHHDMVHGERAVIAEHGHAGLAQGLGRDNRAVLEDDAGVIVVDVKHLLRSGVRVRMPAQVEGRDPIARVDGLIAREIVEHGDRAAFGRVFGRAGVRSVDALGAIGSIDFEAAVTEEGGRLLRVNQVSARLELDLVDTAVHRRKLDFFADENGDLESAVARLASDGKLTRHRAARLGLAVDQAQGGVLALDGLGAIFRPKRQRGVFAGVAGAIDAETVEVDGHAELLHLGGVLGKHRVLHELDGAVSGRVAAGLGEGLVRGLGAVFGDNHRCGAGHLDVDLAVPLDRAIAVDESQTSAADATLKVPPDSVTVAVSLRSMAFLPDALVNSPPEMVAATVPSADRAKPL